jgi:hypothetical protein
MFERQVINFVYEYFIIKTLASLIIMPSLNSKKDAKYLSPKSKQHYDIVKHNRGFKGMISFMIGLVFGVAVFFLEKNMNIKHRVLFSMFIGFFSMNICYEAMWQDKFIFEEQDVNSYPHNSGTYQDTKFVNDMKIYAKIYKKHRLAGNIIEIASIIIALIFSIFYHL